MPDQPQPIAAPTFEALYRAWFRPVVRWLPAMGVGRADVEDLAQEVFITAQRRFDTFDGQNTGGWLYAVSLRIVSNHRRLAWVRKLVVSDSPPERATSETPESALANRQLADVADEILAGMSDKLRRVFVLFEVEGYSGDEIAALEQIPVATVWTRVHNARKQFEERTAKVRKLRGIP
jgi:RNA polymerase sigma-70 factor (ECF subfamily)